MDEKEEKVEEINNPNEKEIKTENEIKKQENAKKTIWKTASKIVQIIAWIIIFILLAILLLTVASKRTDIFGYRIYTIMSGSMEPTIHVKDAIITKQTDEVKEGDIIAFENGNIVTVHRVIKVYTEENTKLYKTKGDNNNTEDPGLVQKQQVKGKVILKLTILGNLILFIQTHFVIFVITVGIIIMIILIRRLI